MKKLSKITLAIILLIGIFFVILTNNSMPLLSNEPTLSRDQNIITIYYSKTGNTKAVAQYIHNYLGGELFEIKPIKEYPDDYHATVQIAKEEKETNDRPGTLYCPDNIQQYDVIFLCYPNWWATMPMLLFTFLENNDLTDKIIIPVCTHEGSNMGTSIDDIKQLAPKSIVLDGIAIRGSKAHTSDEIIKEWLQKIGF